MKCLIEPMKLAMLLREFRDKKHMTQTDLAKILGVPRFTLQRWERGLVRISPIMYRMLIDKNIVLEIKN